tara:strand:+ start:124 stop:873 length:750 start_codon:yes stop_codon:yes gene_type:complete
MGATTPGIVNPVKPIPGDRPPKDDGRPGVRPPRPPKDDGRPGIRPPRPRPPKEAIFPIAGEPPKGGNSPKVFDKLLEDIKKTGNPFGGSERPLVSRPESDFGTVPLGPDDRPLPSSDPFSPEEIKPKIIMGPDDRPVEVWPWGREDDPDYDRKKKEYFEKKMGPMPEPEPFGTGPRRGARDLPGSPRTMRGPGKPRKEAVFFKGRSPSTESRRPTKESPKRGMSKVGPVDTEAKNKFEEMLAYMKRFQK